MELNSQFHTLADLPLVLTGQEADWASQRFWML